MSLFILFYSLFYITLARFRLDLALGILIIGLPSYLIRGSIFGVPTTLLEAMIVIVFLVWLSQNWDDQINKIKLALNRIKANKFDKINYPYDKEIIIFLIISFFSAGIASFSNNALGIWKAYCFEPILLFIVIINVFGKIEFVKIKSKKIKIFDYIVYSFTISAFLVSCFAIFQKITGLGLPLEWMNSGRVTSFFEYPNAVGLYLAPIVLIIFSQLFKIKKSILKNQKKFLIFILIFIASILSIYFASSEGALIGVIIGLAVFGLLISKKARLVTIILIILSSFGILINPKANKFALQKITLTDLAGEIRKQQWRETWTMLTDRNLFFGSGLANYQNAIKDYHQDGLFFNFDNDDDFERKIVIFDERYKSKYWQPVEIYLYPHNIFLNFWTEFGIIGMIFFMWLIGKFFFKGIRIYNKYKIENKNEQFFVLGLISAMVAIIIHGLVDVPYFKNDLAVLFWIMFGIIGIIEIREKIEH